LPQLKVTFGDQVVRGYDNTAINTGYYTFAYVKDGEAKTVPARYSFTYVKDGSNWRIADPTPRQCRQRRSVRSDLPT